MAINASKRVATTDCECCDNVKVSCSEHFGMMMCSDCVAKQASVTNMVTESKTIDTSIQVKTDIFNAATIAAVELRGAIDADESIAADQKDYAYARVCMERFTHFKKVIFDMRAELLQRENELRMWQVQVQTTAATLRTEYRDQFKSLDISYAPAPVKPASIKKASKAPKVGTKKFDHAGVRAAASKYNVPASAVQSLVLSRHLSPEDAGKEVARLMGLI